MKKIYRFGAILMVFGLACLGATNVFAWGKKIDPSKPVGRCTQDFCDKVCTQRGGYSTQSTVMTEDIAASSCQCRIEGSWTSGSAPSWQCYNKPPKIPPPAGLCTQDFCNKACARAGYDSTKSVWFDESQKQWNCRCIKGDELKMVLCATQAWKSGVCTKEFCDPVCQKKGGTYSPVNPWPGTPRTSCLCLKNGGFLDSHVTCP